MRFVMWDEVGVSWEELERVVERKGRGVGGGGYDVQKERGIWEWYNNPARVHPSSVLSL